MCKDAIVAIEAYEPLVVNTCRKLVGSHQRCDQEDARQEGRLGLLVAARKFDATVGSFGTFARHHVFGRVNRSRRRPRTSNDDILLEKADRSYPATGEVVEAAEASRLARQFVRSLPGDLADLARSVFWCGLSSTAYADRVGVSRRTVSTRLTKIRELGRRWFAARGLTGPDVLAHLA